MNFYIRFFLKLKHTHYLSFLVIKIILKQIYRDFNDPVFKFWQAFAQFKLGNTNESINELNSILHKKEIALASIVALMHYH